MPYGDVAFEGRGEGGRAVSVGVEYKQLGELVASLRSQRLQGYQMPGMRDTYDFSYLYVEGELLYDRRGLLQRRSKHRQQLQPLAGQMTVSELFKRLNVLHLCGGLNWVLLPTRKDTLQALESLYHTWTDCDLDKHKSHLGIYQAPSLVPMSETRQVFYRYPHVGIAFSRAVEDRFGSIEAACRGSVAEWAAITTADMKGKARRLGTKAATDIVAFVRGQT